MAPRPRRQPDADVARLRRLLREGPVPACCLLHGEDTHRKERIAAAIVERVLGKGERELGLQRFDGQRHTLPEVLQACLALPMFASQQVILVRHGQDLVRDAVSQQHLVDYVASPAAGTTLVMDCDQLDGRRTWVKALQRAGVVYHVPLPRGNDLTRWCHRLAREAGLTLTDEQAARLLDLVGDDLQLLRNELATLALMQADDARGDVSGALDRMIARRQVDLFELVKSLRPGGVSQALALWHRFRAEGRDVYELVPLLAWRIRQLCGVLELAESGLDAATAAGVLGASPYAVREVLGQRSQWSGERRRAALAACRNLEVAIKTGRLEPEIAVERFLVELAGTTTRPAAT